MVFLRCGRREATRCVRAAEAATTRSTSGSPTLRAAFVIVRTAEG